MRSFDLSHPLPHRSWGLLVQISRACWHLFLLYTVFAYRRQLFLGYPLVVEGIIQAICSEFNRRKMVWRRQAAHREVSEEKVEEGGMGGMSGATCIATVVGYREDPAIFRQCLQSYATNFDQRHKAVCIGIDGQDAADLQMRDVADAVFGDKLVRINLDQSFGDLVRTWTNPEEGWEKFDVSMEDGFDWVTATLIAKATDTLRSFGVSHCSASDPTPICITQPHGCKKEIMFTTFIFALALARINDVGFIWSSDSDSWVFADTIATVIDCIAPDEGIAGSCTSLTIHNGDASLVAGMVAATYQTDLALTSGLLSACDTTDCQSGPCAVFRSHALRSIILPWYNQRVLGQRPIVNEDRHLTTSLLLRGHKVTYNPLVMVATDTPTTTANWCAQQVRWARATAIETLCYPRMFTMRHPVLFIYSFRRLAVPVVNFAVVTKYLFTGRGSEFSSMQDIGVRIILCAIYASCHHRNGLKGFIVHAFSQVFLQVPQAAFLFYAIITMFDSSWGGGFRADNKRSGLFWQQVGGKHFGALLTTLIWTVMVVAAFARYMTTQNTFGVGFVSSFTAT